MTYNKNTITLETKFSELPENNQKYLLDIESHIQSIQILKKELPTDTKDEVSKVSKMIEKLNNSLSRCIGVFEKTNQLVDGVKIKTKEESKIGDNASRTLQLLEDPYNSRLENLRVPSPYFWSLLEKFNKKKLEYKSVLSEIEQMIEYVSNGISLEKTYQEGGDIIEILKIAMVKQNEYFLTLTGKIAILQEEIKEIKEKFLDIYQNYSNNPRNVFKESSKKKKTDSLSFQKPKEDNMSRKNIQQIYYPNHTLGFGFNKGSLTNNSTQQGNTGRSGGGLFGNTRSGGSSGSGTGRSGGLFGNTGSGGSSGSGTGRSGGLFGNTRSGGSSGSGTGRSGGLFSNSRSSGSSGSGTGRSGGLFGNSRSGGSGSGSGTGRSGGLFSNSRSGGSGSGSGTGRSGGLFGNSRSGGSSGTGTGRSGGLFGSSRSGGTRKTGLFN
ncbi:nucleoporin p58/p45 [Anaeramoeba flamelloides]|uniref:Nucleoporin p58/p45 n=1 Tax=Anaeramoeba flamelloides TaxID=1746091 RepID=A0ABQ8YVI8_9EUKA|nr:nucleoporin p58/p45 [Anaeramoeba flamelloides]